MAPFWDTICTEMVPPEADATLRFVLCCPFKPKLEPGDTVMVRSAQPSDRLTRVAL